MDAPKLFLQIFPSPLSSSVCNWFALSWTFRILNRSFLEILFSIFHSLKTLKYFQIFPFRRWMKNSWTKSLKPSKPAIVMKLQSFPTVDLIISDVRNSDNNVCWLRVLTLYAHNLEYVLLTFYEKTGNWNIGLQ